MLVLSATYRQLCALSLEKLMDTAVPGMEVLGCSLMSCSATKPHLPGSPFGLPHGFPSAGSFRSNTWIRSLPRSQTQTLPPAASFTQWTGNGKNEVFLLPLE